MEGSKLGKTVYRGGEEIFREIFQQYGDTIYAMLLSRGLDQQTARTLLKDIFREVYEEIISAGSVDITAVWLKAIAEAQLQKLRIAQGSTPGQLPGQPQQAESRQRPQVPVAGAPPAQVQQMPRPAQQAVQQPLAQPPQSAAAQAPSYRQQPQAQQAAWPVQQQAPRPMQQAVPRPQPAGAPTGPGQPIPAPRQQQTSFEPYIPAGKKETGKQKNVGRIVLIAGLSVLILMTLWLLAGLLMDMSVLPEIDLGYEWFNKNVFPLF